MKKLSLGLILYVYAFTASAQNFVDLGLPSGILWADANEPGLYTFDESAAAYRGNEMPGMREFKELVDVCEWRWNGSGYTVIGPNGDSIVFPMVQTKYCTGGMETGTSGYYWSAEAYDDFEGWGLYFSKDMISTTMSFARCQGLPVRKIQHPSRAFYRPDYDAIQSIGKPAYEKLLKRFRAEDTTLTLADKQAIYFGSAFYGYYAAVFDEKKVAQMVDANKKPKEILKYIDNYLKSCPADMRALLYRASVSNMAKDPKSVAKYSHMFIMLCQAVLQSGDGETDSTAYHVATVADEYTLMWYMMEVNPERQILTSTMCDLINATTKSGRKIDIYFDVQLVLALERRMFSDSDEPFHFTYVPQTGESEPVADFNMGGKDSQHADEELALPLE